MTTQNLASRRPAARPHRRIRTAAAITSVAALIATGGYLATTIGPDAAPTTPAAGTAVNPSAQVQRELRQSIAGQYGNQFAAAAVVNPSAQTLRELRASIAGQYGNRFAASAAVNPNAQVQRELCQSIAGQYGPAR